MYTLYVFHTGELHIRNVIVLTSDIGEKWYKLGIALCIPSAIMEHIFLKHRENPMKALNRVYRYWLADENGLEHTWDKLISALKYIKEHTMATTVEQYINVSLYVATIRIHKTIHI